MLPAQYLMSCNDKEWMLTVPLKGKMVLRALWNGLACKLNWFNYYGCAFKPCLFKEEKNPCVNISIGLHHILIYEQFNLARNPI